MKPLPLIAAIAIGGSALWSAGWFVGKAVFIEPEADRAVEDFRSGRLFFSYDEREISGFPFAYDVAYRNVAVSDHTTAWRWTIPEIHIASGLADAGTVSLTTAPKSTLEVTGGAASADSPIVIDIESDGFVAHQAVGADGDAVVKIAANSISAVQQGSGGVVSGARLVLGGVTFEQSSTSEETGQSAIQIDSMSIAYRMSPDGVTETWQETETSGLSVDIKFDMTGYDPAAPAMFVTQGGAIEIAASARSGSGKAGSTGGPSSPPFTMDFANGATTINFAVGEGRLVYSGKAESGRIGLTYAEGGPVPPIAFEMGAVEVNFEMPTEPSENVQSYGILLAMDGTKFDDNLWNMFDPSAALPRDPFAFRFDIGGDARLFRPLMEIQSKPQSGPPIELETMQIRDSYAKGMGAAITVSGDLDIRGAAARPDGEVTVVIDGALALIDKLTLAGLIPPGAGDLYIGMGQQILRPGEGDDQFIADIVSKDGNVMVNGQPIGG